MGSTTITTTPPPTDGGSPAITPPTITPQQTIDDTISTIENLDSIPQSLKTNIVTLLRQVLDSLNDMNATGANTTTLTTATETESMMNQALSLNPIAAPFG